MGFHRVLVCETNWKTSFHASKERNAVFSDAYSRNFYMWLKFLLLVKWHPCVLEALIYIPDYMEMARWTLALGYFMIFEVESRAERIEVMNYNFLSGNTNLLVKDRCSSEVHNLFIIPHIMRYDFVNEPLQYSFSLLFIFSAFLSVSHLGIDQLQFIDH